MPEQAIDPVCQMTVDPDEAPASAEHQGETYYVCAPGCKAAFEKAPDAYLGDAPEPGHSH